MAVRLFALLLALFIKACFAAAPANPSPSQWCMYGCNQAVDYNTFAGQPNASDGYYLGPCRNELQVSSMWACARKYCTKDELDAGSQWVSSYCLYYAGIDVLPISIIGNLTDEDINNLPVLDFGGLDTVNVTSLVNATTYDHSYRTGADYYTQVMHHITYAQSLFIFWGIVVGIGTLLNVYRRFGPNVNVAWLVKAKGIFVTAPYTAMQGDGTRAPLAETLVNLAFLIVNIVLCAVSYTAFDGNIFWSNVPLQTWRYLADRTGYLAYANLAILWFFGIRNDILIWFTGWSFATFSRFHRMVAIICTFEAIIHSIAYTCFSFLYGTEDYIESFAEQYWVCGVVATVLMSFILIFSISWLRLRWYDLFLAIHIIFALVALVMLYYHTAIFDGEFDGYIWACVALWGFDRLVRIGRIVWNVSTAKSTKCLIEYDQDADLVRVEVTEALGRWGQLSAGSHFYMYLIKTLRFWESHPFTMTRWKSADEAGEGSVWHYSFVIRPYDGFTRTMAKHALRGPTIRTCLFEGPYGAEPSLHKTHTSHGLTEVLYIMGGSGISVAISSLYSLLERDESSSTSPKIKLVWAVRNHSFLNTILDRELRHAKSRIDIDAYVTQNSTATIQIEHGNEVQEKTFNVTAAESNESSDDNSNIGTGTDLGFTYGRPDIRQCVLDAAKESRGTVGIVMCGPVSMMSDVRKAVVEANKDGVQRIRLFAEDFSW